MAAVLVLSGCSAIQDATGPTPAQATATPSAPPAPTPSGAPWAQDLAFSGDFSGRMTGVVPNQPQQRSDCTGLNSKAAGQWASTIFGLVGSSVYGLVFTVSPYRGPGAYPSAAVQVHSADQKAVWQTLPGDQIVFTVSNDEQSGTLDATLTSAVDARSKLRVSGSWSCRS